MALLWLKPLARRTVKESQSAVAPAVDLTAPAKA